MNLEHSLVVRPGGKRRLAWALSVGLAFTSCAGADRGGTTLGVAVSPGQTAPDAAVVASSTTEPSTASTAPTNGSVTTSSSTSRGPVVAPQTDPRGPDVQLFTLPECQTVPNGALDGQSDLLVLFVAVRNGGPGAVSKLVPVSVESDTGLRSSSNNAVSTGSSFNALQVSIDAKDYNRTHRFTIIADPDWIFVERDETNNSLTVSVTLGRRRNAAERVACVSP